MHVQCYGSFGSEEIKKLLQKGGGGQNRDIFIRLVQKENLKPILKTDQVSICDRGEEKHLKNDIKHQLMHLDVILIKWFSLNIQNNLTDAQYSIQVTFCTLVLHYKIFNSKLFFSLFFFIKQTSFYVRDFILGVSGNKSS